MHRGSGSDKRDVMTMGSEMRNIVIVDALSTGYNYRGDRGKGLNLR